MNTSAPRSTTIYTKPGCPFCTKIKEVYKIKGWSYREQVLNENFSRDQFHSQFGGSATFPQLIVDGENTGGCNETLATFKKRGLI
jgi:glutaredoxin 3